MKKLESIAKSLYLDQKLPHFRNLYEHNWTVSGYTYKKESQGLLCYAEFLDLSQ